jgi:hypothetical protein
MLMKVVSAAAAVQLALIPVAGETSTYPTG